MPFAPSRTRPNVVLFLADDLGYGDLSCYGNTILSTPNIDRLAAEGVRCSQHYSGAPICAPARAALLTGRYHHRCGALSVESNRGLDRIALRERTIGDAFAAAGYHTGYVGKWHSGVHDPRFHPNQRGFAEFAGSSAASWTTGTGFWTTTAARAAPTAATRPTYSPPRRSTSSAAARRRPAPLPGSRSSW